MKKYFCYMVIVCVILLVGVFYNFSMAEQGRKYVGSYEAATKPIVKNLTAAVGFYELLDDAELSSTQRFVIDKIIISGAVAAKVYFNDSNTASDVGYGAYAIPTAGGTVIDSDIFLQLDLNSGLYVTSSATVDILVERHIKN